VAIHPAYTGAHRRAKISAPGPSRLAPGLATHTVAWRMRARLGGIRLAACNMDQLSYLAVSRTFKLTGESSRALSQSRSGAGGGLP
jgi:hypothetical protein